MNMEDAHISNGELDSDASLFAVFDGHGGAEVAMQEVAHPEPRGAAGATRPTRGAAVSGVNARVDSRADSP